ncbi:MAG: AAA family ATPase, partial [Candidatus Gracilibacteria bacterium]|nr:AAA family ATPase [Candidatus Gracilibacteria bacterium]
YLKTGKKIVVLIDEYDKAILDNINKTEIAVEVREELKGFYATLKDADEYLEFVFITGVSKFSKVSLFSGLNNLKDLTLDPIAGELVGFTEQEITDNLGEYLEDVDRKKMKKWYNGFNFLGENTVYNPYDVLLFLDSKEYKAHWFETATPSFLIKLLKESDNFYHIPDLQNITSGEKLLGSFDIENINLETLLFQTGYLTIKEKITYLGETSYLLQIPNQEIKKSLNDYLMTDYLGVYRDVNFIKRVGPIYEALVSGNIEEFIKYLKVLFANISYTNSLEKIAKYEGYYSSIIYCLFYTMGIDVIQEDITNHGRIDLTLKINNLIFIIEFKIEKSGLNALEQIKEKKYSEKYNTPLNPPLHEGDKKREIYEIGINFSFEDRNIESYEFEKKIKN